MIRADIKTRYIFQSTLFCVIFTGLLVAFSFLKSLAPVNYERIAYGTIGTVVSLLTTWLFLRFDKKSFSDIDLTWERSTAKKFLAGMLTGIALMGLLAMGVIYFSDFKIELNKNASVFNFLFLTLPLIPLAVMEEVGFRAYPLWILKNNAGLKLSIIITSILFALYHIPNGWTVTGSLLGPGVWGIIFGLAAICSNGISMPTGIHYAANLTTAAFGVTDNSFNLWILKQKDGSSLQHYQASQLATLIPQLCLLLVGIAGMLWLLRKKPGS